MLIGALSGTALRRGQHHGEAPRECSGALAADAHSYRTGRTSQLPTRRTHKKSPTEFVKTTDGALQAARNNGDETSWESWQKETRKSRPASEHSWSQLGPLP